MLPRLALVLCSAICGCLEACTSRPAASVGSDGFAPDQSAVLPECRALSGYAGGKRLTTTQLYRAVFSKDLSRLLLLAKKGKGHYFDLVHVELPSGKSEVLAQEISSAGFMGSGEQAVLAVRSSVTTSSSFNHLLLIKPGSGSTETLVTHMKQYKATPDGSRVYVVREESGQDTLEVLHLQKGTCTLLHTGQVLSDLAVSADGTYLAFVGSPIPSGCSPNDRLGTSYVVDAAGSRRTLAPMTSADGTEFLSSGRVLLQVRTSCNGQTQLKLASPAGGAPTLLVQGWLEFDNPRDWWEEDQSYYVTTSDLKYVLGGEFHPIENHHYKLLAVRTDGSGSRVLALDLSTLMMSGGGIKVFGLTADGRHVVYLTVSSSQGSTTGLAAVPLAGGQTRPLTPSLDSFAFSDLGDEVAFLTRSSSGRYQVKLASASSASSRLLFETEKTVYEMCMVPGGRGLVLAESQTSVGSTLSYLSRQGGGSTALATSKSNLSFSMDSSGCALVYDVEGSASGDGTYLGLIPR